MIIITSIITVNSFRLSVWGLSGTYTCDTVSKQWPRYGINPVTA